MRTSLHDIHLPARRIFALLISVATLIATLPTAARAQAEPPGALDLATLPGTLNNNWYINLAYLNGTWVYKVGASDTQAPTTGTPFNGTITGTMPEVGRQFVIHPSTDSDSVLTSADPDSGNPPALTLKDAVITSSFNQLFYIKAGAEPTLRIEGENRRHAHPDRSRCAGDKPRYPKRISRGHGYAHGLCPSAAQHRRHLQLPECPDASGRRDTCHQ